MTMVRSGATAGAAVTATAEVRAGTRVGELYISDDPSVNTPLTLTVNLITQGDQPIPPPQDPSRRATSLSVSLGSVVDSAAVQKIKMSAPGWNDAVFFPGPWTAWTLTPKAQVAAGPVTITIENLAVGGSARQAKMTVDYRNLGPAGSGKASAPVSIVPKPEPGFSVDCDNTRIFVTREGEAEFANTIEFAIRVLPTVPAVPPTAPPPAAVFSLFFKYGDEYGALTTVARAKAAELTQVGGPSWHDPEKPNPEGDDAVWRLRPREATDLGPGASASFRLSRLVSQIAANQTEFAPQPVAMCLRYSGVPGIPDGIRTVPLWKEAAIPKIVSLRADRSEVDAGEAVTLSWATNAVDELTLHYSTFDRDGIEHSETYPGEDGLDEPLQLPVGEFVVYPKLERIDYVLTAYSLEGPSRTRIWKDEKPKQLTGFRPVIKDGSVQYVGDAHDNSPVTVVAQAYHADSVTFDDPVSGQPVTSLLPKTTLTAPCAPTDSQIAIAALSVDWTGEFDLQIDQEFMTVTGVVNDRTWTVRRQGSRSAHSAGAVATVTRTSAQILVQRNNSLCTARAWKNGVSSESSPTPPLHISIKPIIKMLVADPAAARPGAPVTISWTIDEAEANLKLDPDPHPGQKLEGTSITFPIARPTTFTLKATSKTYGNLSDTRSVSVGCYATTTIPLSGGQPVGMSLSPAGKLYILNNDLSITVVDVTANAVLKRIAIPAFIDSGDWNGRGMAVRAYNAPLGFSPGPFGLVVEADVHVKDEGVEVEHFKMHGMIQIDSQNDTLGADGDDKGAKPVCARALRSDGSPLSVGASPTPESIAAEMQTPGSRRAYLLNGSGTAVLVVDYQFPS